MSIPTPWFLSSDFAYELNQRYDRAASLSAMLTTVAEAYPTLSCFLGSKEWKSVTVPNAEIVSIKRSKIDDSIFIDFPPLPSRGTDPEIHFDPYQVKSNGAIDRFRSHSEGPLTVLESRALCGILDAVLQSTPATDERRFFAEEALLATFRQTAERTVAADLHQIIHHAERRILEIICDDYRDKNPGCPVPSEVFAIKPGNREGLCTKASAIVCEEAIRRGHHLLALGAERTIQLRQLTKLIIPDDREVFRHYFAVVSVYGKAFLVDRTACQFVGQQGQIGSRFIATSCNESLVHFTGREVSEYPVLQSLMTDGFVEFNAVNLTQYMQALTLNQNPGFQQALTATFDQQRLNCLFTEVDTLH